MNDDRPKQTTIAAWLRRGLVCSGLLLCAATLYPQAFGEDEQVPSSGSALAEESLRMGDAHDGQPAGQEQQAEPAGKPGTPSRSACLDCLTASPLQSAASLRLWPNGPDYTTAMWARASGCKLSARQALLPGCCTPIEGNGGCGMPARELPGRRNRLMWLDLREEETERIQQGQVLATVGPRPAHQRDAAIGPGSWNASVKRASLPPPLR